MSPQSKFQLTLGKNILRANCRFHRSALLVWSTQKHLMRTYTRTNANWRRTLEKPPGDGDAVLYTSSGVDLHVRLQGID